MAQMATVAADRRFALLRRLNLTTPAQREGVNRLFQALTPTEPCYSELGAYLCAPGTSVERVVTASPLEMLRCARCKSGILLQYYATTMPEAPAWSLPLLGTNQWYLPRAHVLAVPVYCGQCGRIGARMVHYRLHAGPDPDEPYATTRALYFVEDRCFVYHARCPSGMPVNIIAYYGPRTIPEPPAETLVSRPYARPFRLSFCLNQARVGDDMQRRLYCPCHGYFAPMHVRLATREDYPGAFDRHLLMRGHPDHQRYRDVAEPDTTSEHSGAVSDEASAAAVGQSDVMLPD